MKQKKIYDPVHGFIRFNEWEGKLIDSLPFQRLHSLHQLGIAYLVYPGATHTRFEHSLGVMELASRIFDQVASQSPFSQEAVDYPYWRQIVRLAALTHDLGHLPFSHVAEKALLGKEGHEKWTMEIIKSSFLSPLWEEMKKHFPGHTIEEDLIKISVGEKKLQDLGLHYSFSFWEKIVCEIISGDFFGADRMDYLIRDAKCTGVAYGLFDYHQLIEMLCILPLQKKGEFALGIEENGIQSCEALLLARHFMHKRVYQYSSVKAYSFHLARFMKMLYKQQEMHDLDSYVFSTDHEVIAALHQAYRDKKHPAHLDAASILQRKQRFKALELPEGISEQELLELKNALAIGDREIGWELCKKNSSSIGLSFPVLKENATIVPASACSQIVIPLGSISWLFVAPAFATAVQKYLEKTF